jgi:hypothetical protein
MALGLVLFSPLQRLVACPKRREGEREGVGVSNWLNFIRWEFVLYLFILKKIMYCLILFGSWSQLLETLPLPNVRTSTLKNLAIFV